MEFRNTKIFLPVCSGNSFSSYRLSNCEKKIFIFFCIKNDRLFYDLIDKIFASLVMRLNKYMKNVQTVQ